MYRTYLLLYTRAEIGFDLKICKLDITKICAEEKNTGKCSFLVKKQVGMLHRLKEIVTFALRKVGNVR